MGWDKGQSVFDYFECMCHYLDFAAKPDKRFEMDLKHAVLEDIMPKVRLAKRCAHLIQRLAVKHGV